MAMRKRFRAKRVKKFEKLVEKAKKRGISRERLEERIKVFGRIVWLSKWKKISFEESIEFAKKKYDIKEVSKKVREVLWELERGNIGYSIVEKIKGKEFIVALPWLYWLSFRKDFIIKMGVAYALGRIGVWNEDVKEILERLSRDESAFVRANVAAALGDIGVWNDVVGKMLDRLSKDNDKDVREYVAEALGKIGVWNDVVGEVLESLSIDGHGDVRKGVARALGEIEVWNKNIEEMLMRLNKDENWRVRESVAVALGKIVFGENWEKVQKEFERIEDKCAVVLIGFIKGKFDKRKFLKDWRYREQLLDLVKAMSVEKLKEFIYGKK